MCRGTPAPDSAWPPLWDWFVEKTALHVGMEGMGGLLLHMQITTSIMFNIKSKNLWKRNDYPHTRHLPWNRAGPLKRCFVFPYSTLRPKCIFK